MPASKSELLEMALESIDNEEMRPVLADAIVESGWWHRNMWVFANDATQIASFKEPHRFKYLAALLMFEDWPDGIVEDGPVYKCWIHYYRDEYGRIHYDYLTPHQGYPGQRIIRPLKDVNGCILDGSLNAYRLHAPDPIHYTLPERAYLTLADRIKLAEETPLGYISPHEQDPARSEDVEEEPEPDAG